MLLAFASNDVTKIILWVVLIAAVLGLVALMWHTVIVSRRKKKNAQNDAANDAQNDNADEFADGQNVESDRIVMSRNVIYSVGADGQISVGKYILANADGASDKFNVRVNGLVREYSNGDELTLAVGDTLSPVSGAVVLTKAED